MFRSVLVLAPHTDDGELGCGGTIDKFAKAGAVVHYAAFSTAESSVPQEYPSDILKTEVRHATGVLGIEESALHIFNYPVRNFPAFRQQILEDMRRLNTIIQPDLVFLPGTTDVHQDHQVIAAEGLRAFKLTSVLAYELPWNNLSMNTSCFVKLDEGNLHNKVRALSCYESQKHKRYFDPEFIRSLAITRGTQIDTSYAEAFEVIRWVL